MMIHPKLKVINDPIPFVFRAYTNLYSDKMPDLIQLTDLKNPIDKGWATTLFCDDGKVVIAINHQLPLEHYPEIMAHELAHVAVGLKEEHGLEWENAFEAIFNEFNRLVEEAAERRNKGGEA